MKHFLLASAAVICLSVPAYAGSFNDAEILQMGIANNATQIQDGYLIWLCHKSGKPLKLKGNLRRFWVRLETKNLFDFNHLTINLTMFMT
jgi:hypothetical protein